VFRPLKFQIIREMKFLIQVQKGSLVEVLSGGEWWDAEVTKLKAGQARVHYVGGADDEDEWIPISRFSIDSTVTIAI
jgi:hypothetical protein